VQELLAITDRELAALEEILGIEAKGDSITPDAHPRSKRTLDESQILDAVDATLARRDTLQTERLLDLVDTPTGSGPSDQPPAHGHQFEPTETDIGLDMLFLVTTGLSAPHNGEYSGGRSCTQLLRGSVSTSGFRHRPVQRS